jgi:hypothetical protein
VVFLRFENKQGVSMHKRKALNNSIFLFYYLIATIGQPLSVFAAPNISSPEDLEDNYVPPTPVCTVTKLNYIPYTAAEWFALTGSYNAPQRAIFVPPNPRERCLNKVISEAVQLCGTGSIGYSGTGEVVRDPIFENYINNRGGGGQWGVDDCSYYYVTWAYKYGVSTNGLFNSLGNDRQALLNEFGRRVSDLVANTPSLANFSPNDASVLYPQFTSTPHSSYLDSDCNIAAPVNDAQLVCEELTHSFLISPISLIWEESASIDEIVSISDFPLSKSEGKFVHWRGSAKTPLLVYDPEHTGQISSADQVFGNWTFGGKTKFASLNSSNVPTVATPWSNGFEALGTLDFDNNGKVDGKELDALGLWFDNNQDGKSNKGEVLSAKDVGLKSLFYANPIMATDGSKAELSIGFEKEVDNKVLAGKAVDWFSDEFSTASEALINLQANRTLKRIELPRNELNSTKEDTSDYSTEKRDIKLDGNWEWKLAVDHVENNDKAFKNSLGLLSLKANKDVIWGQSISEIPLSVAVAGKKQNIKAGLSFNPISGKRLEDEAFGKVKYEFSIKDAQGTLTTSSLSIDKEVNGFATQISGASETKLVNNEGQPLQIKYKWVAKRLDTKL